MANISSYINDIENAVYGEQVRSSIVSAIEAVNDDNESYQQIKEDILGVQENIFTVIAPIESRVQDVENRFYETIKTGTSNSTPYLWMSGVLSTEDGVTHTENSKVVCNSDYVMLKSNKINISIKSGYKVAFLIYNANKNFIKATSFFESSGYQTDLQDKENYYVRANVRKINGNSPEMSDEPFYTISAEDVFGTEAESESGRIPDTGLKYEPVSFSVSSGYYRVDQKTVVTQYGYFHTSISVSAGEYYLCTGMTIAPSANIPCAVAVDSSGNALKLYGGTTETGAKEYFNFFVEIPKNAATLYINGFSADGIDIQKCTEDYFNNVYSPRKLIGKTVVFLGDSIFGNNNTSNSIPNIFARLTGAKVHNFAIGGTRGKSRSSGTSFSTSNLDCWGAIEGERLAQAIATGNWSSQLSAVASGSAISAAASYTAARIAEMSAFDFSTVDYFIFNWATNDYTGESGIEGYATGITSVIQLICTAYPNAIAIKCTPTQRFNIVSQGDNGNTNLYNGVSLKDYFEKDTELSTALNIQLINLYNIGINNFNASVFINSADGVHPTLEGRKRIAAVIADSVC